ncbi:hypothetical protein SDJN03_11928, partial [Cucurbita argyrosperma subsp. sororia]
MLPKLNRYAINVTCQVFLSLIFHATVFAEIIFDYGLLDFCFPASSRSCFLPLSSSTLRWWIVVSAGIGSRLQLPAENRSVGSTGFCFPSGCLIS